MFLLQQLWFMHVKILFLKLRFYIFLPRKGRVGSIRCQGVGDKGGEGPAEGMLQVLTAVRRPWA